MDEDTYDVIVVGGGPAGMMAAGRAGERGRRVLLLERGPALGRKLLLTGGGRCNVTNIAPLPDFLKAFGRNGGFLRPALTHFGPQDLRDWLAERGIDTVEEAGGCVFPATGNARSVRDALAAYVNGVGVDVRLSCRVEGLLTEEGGLAGVTADGTAFGAVRVLIACGGLSYPETGSSGDGYALARQAGHSITPTYAAVCGLETREEWPRGLQGTPAGAVRVRVRGRRGRTLASSTGPAVWTHFGLSGPPVLDVSCAAVQAIQKGDAVVLDLDLTPDDVADDLRSWLADVAEVKGRRIVQSVLAERFPARTAAVLLELAGVDGRRPMAQCSKKDRAALVDVLKQLELHVVGPRPVSEAILTGGGVALSEIDANRMESMRLPGLHFAGEVLDLQAPCGGFNLQAAFSMGRLVGDVV